MYELSFLDKCLKSHQHIVESVEKFGDIFIKGEMRFHLKTYFFLNQMALIVIAV